MNIVSLFLHAAESYPNHLAIIHGKQTITYQALKEQVLSTAAYFSSRGIKAGDRVLVFVPMRIELYQSVLALFYLGATAVFLDEWVSKKRMEMCCQIADCTGFVAGKKIRMLAVFSKELRKIPIKLAPNKVGKDKVALTPLSGKESALITFTTGSTGVPKAADRSHHFLHAQFKALLHEIQPTAQDIDLTAMPIVLFVNLGTGGTSVIPDVPTSKLNPALVGKVVDQLHRHQVTRITASPHSLKLVAAHLSQTQEELPALKKVFTGGAPVFPSEAKQLTGAFGESAIKIVYGSTEAEPISSIPASLLSNRDVGSEGGLPVGHLYPHTSLRILRLRDAPYEPCDSQTFQQYGVEQEGEIGEIVVSGPHVLDRYYNNPQAFATNKILVDSVVWHRTGDSGFISHGELFLTGRCKQLIPTPSGWIAPFIIENQLLQIPNVTCGTLLHLNTLILVLESKLKKEELLPLVSFIQHDELVVVSKIPRDPRHQSKLDYEALSVLVKHVVG